MELNKLTQEQFQTYLDVVSEAKKEVLETLVDGDYEDFGDVETVYNYGCRGGVNGFIYYSETEGFFDRHVDEVMEEAENFVRECDGVPKGFNFTRNDFTWLFVENTVSEFMGEVEWLEEEEEIDEE